MSSALDINQTFAPLSPGEIRYAASANQPETPRGECITPVPADAPVPTFRHPEFGQPVTAWPYHDATGALLGYVARYEPPGMRKQFVPWTVWREDARLRWRMKNPPDPRPLYGLDRLAASPAASVVVVEGEKCADAAVQVFPTSVVVTSPGGSNASHKADWSPLAGRKVLLWPDADEAGTRYARAVAEILDELGVAELRTVDALALAARAPDGTSREAPDGWDVADALNEGWSPDRLRRAAVPPPEPEASFISFGSYRMSRKGLFFDGGTDAGPVWLSGAFEILAATRDDAGSNWGLMLRWRDPDAREHSWSMPRSLLYGDGAALCAALAERGLAVAPGAKARNLILAYLATVDTPDRVTCVARTGWHEVGGEPVFVLPERTLGGAAERSIVLQAANAVRSPFATRGSPESWQALVAAPCEHNSRLAFAISIALAGPLLWVMGQEGGGFHLYGASSQGKTTALHAAASVWGRGDKGGFVGTWRGTANGMEGIAAMHSDAVLILDEIGQADARTVAEAGYMLAQGIGKARAGRNGEARQPARWRTLILSSGELTQAAKIGEERGRTAAAGQMVRLLDIPSDAGAGLGAFDVIPTGMAGAKELADHVKRATAEHYGHAGPAFIEAVAGDLNRARADIHELVEVWISRHGLAASDGQVKRACDRFALVAAAGELAIALRLLPWARGAAAAAAAALFRSWITSRGGVEASEVTAGIAQVRRFIEAHGQSRFEETGPLVEVPRLVSNRAGYRRGAGAQEEWWVLPETWKAEICIGLDPTQTARVLAERGMLLKSADGFASVRKIGGRPTRVYVLTADVLAGGGVSDPTSNRAPPEA